MVRGRFVALAWLALALALGLVGQFSFARYPNLLWDGLICYGLAIAAFFLATRPGSDGVQRRVLGWRLQRLLVSLRGRWAAPVIGLILSALFVGVQLRMLVGPPRQSYALPFLLWIAAFVAFAWGVLRKRDDALLEPGAPVGAAAAPVGAAAAPAAVAPETRPAGSSRPRARWRMGSLVLLFLVALALRAWGLSDIPSTLGGDEANWGLDAVKVLAGEIRNPFTTGWLGAPSMGAFLYARCYQLLGQNMFSLRLLSAIPGALTVVVLLALASRLQNQTVGWLSAALLATYGYHIHFSRLGGINMAGDLLMTVSMWCFVRAVQENRRVYWLLTGAVAGFAQYCYPGARLIGVVLFLSSGALLLRGGFSSWKRHAPNLVVMAGAALVVAAPMVQFATLYPDEYNMRMNQVGIVQSGWLDAEVAIRGQSKLAILIDQFWRSVLAWNLYPDRTLWYGAPGPLLGFLPSIFFLIGLGISTVRLFDLGTFPMAAWWWAGTLLGGMLMTNPPASQRLISLTIPACFFVALALERSAVVLVNVSRLRPRAVHGLLSVVVAVMAAASLKAYFLEYTPSQVYGNPDAVVATSLGKYANQKLGKEWRIVFFGAPRMYVGFPTLPYLAPDTEGIDVMEPLVAPPSPDFAGSGKNLAFVFLPERMHELELVRATFPDGEIVEGPSQMPGNAPAYVLYNVRRHPAGSAESGS